jgi:hypothetical protein
MWLDSHVRGRVAVSRNLVRVIVLEVFMLAGRVFFSRVIRLGLGHDEAAFGMTERKEKDGLVNNRKSHLCFICTPHTPEGTPGCRIAAGPGRSPCQRRF